jgi:hypothetical protein
LKAFPEAERHKSCSTAFGVAVFSGQTLKADLSIELAPFGRWKESTLAKLATA